MVSDSISERFTSVNLVVTDSAPYLASATPNTTEQNFTESCAYYKKNLLFDESQLVRVLISWLLFLFSSCGNAFVLWCIFSRTKRSHVHVITLHLTLADLVYTFFAIPMEAIWNTTMAWHGGVALCKIFQMLKQFGMYISSFMVMVIALDRVFSILSPMSNLQHQRARTKILLTTAWVLSALSSVPAGFLFSIVKTHFCEDEPPFPQCIDFAHVTQNKLKPYYFYTMCMSFVIPMLFSVVSYSLIFCEISNMLKRDQVMMGRRESANYVNMERARKKTLFLTSLVTLTFLTLWGPYYGLSIYMWFNPEKSEYIPSEVTNSLFLLMFVHPSVHPIIYGAFMKDVRKKFSLVTGKLIACITFGRIMSHPKSQTPRKQSIQKVQPRVYKRKRPIQDYSTPILSSTRTSRLVVSSEHSTSIPEHHPANRDILLCSDKNFLSVPHCDVQTVHVNNNRDESLHDVSKEGPLKSNDFYLNKVATTPFASSGNSESNASVHIIPPVVCDDTIGLLSQ